MKIFFLKYKWDLLKVAPCKNLFIFSQRGATKGIRGKAQNKSKELFVVQNLQLNFLMVLFMETNENFLAVAFQLQHPKVKYCT